MRYTKSNDYIFNVERKPYKENTQQVGIHSTYSGSDNKIDLARGTPITDWWTDINTVTGWSPEKTDYPTQKPLALYRRIIAASSKENDVVLDPFCGCATTPVAAEQLGRRWIGMDNWDKTHQVVLDRLNAEKRMFDKSDIRLIDDPDRLERTDDSDAAVAFLPEVQRRNRQTIIKRDEMLDMLVKDWGCVCWGCGFEPPDKEYLELDHIRPKSDAGSNELFNRAPLCGPCNRRKSNRIGLGELRRINRKAGRWHGKTPIDVRADLNHAMDWAMGILETRVKQGAFIVGA